MIARYWSRRRCPDWCGGGHLCTAHLGYPGEHRSQPENLLEHDLAGRRRGQPRYGKLVVTRIEDRQGRGRLEVRANVRLARDQDLARDQAQQVAIEIDAAIREALGLPAQPDGPARPAAQRDLGARALHVAGHHREGGGGR